MRSIAWLPVTLFALLLITCTGEVGRRDDAGRVGELEDSLRAYQDSLRAVQHYWTFNNVSPVVLMNHEPTLGDSCVAEVLLVAWNGEHQEFAFQRPELHISHIHNRHMIKEAMRRWVVDFKPEQTGLDSITGWMRVPRPFGLADTVWFCTTYDVKAR